MRHATSETLASLDPLLQRLREITELREKSTGVFYLKSKAFLHFHEDNGKVFADVRLHPPDFDRLPATSRAEQDQLVRRIRQRLS